MKIELFRPRTRIRPARRRDVPGCAAILMEWIGETPWLPRLHTLAETEAWLAGVLFRECRVLMAREGGFVAVDRHDRVQALYVAAGARGRGVGTALLDAAKAMAPGGLTLWTFEPNLAARRFYARHGFTEIRRTAGENDEGVPDILLEWRP